LHCELIQSYTITASRLGTVRILEHFLIRGFGDSGIRILLQALHEPYNSFELRRLWLGKCIEGEPPTLLKPGTAERVCKDYTCSLACFMRAADKHSKIALP